MATDLETKVEKYESKTAQCKEWARQATEVFAGYYGEVAADFRQVIAKRKNA